MFYEIDAVRSGGGCIFRDRVSRGYDSDIQGEREQDEHPRDIEEDIEISRLRSK